MKLTLIGRLKNINIGILCSSILYFNFYAFIASLIDYLHVGHKNFIHLFLIYCKKDILSDTGMLPVQGILPLRSSFLI